MARTHIIGIVSAITLLIQSDLQALPKKLTFTRVYTTLKTSNHKIFNNRALKTNTLNSRLIKQTDKQGQTLLHRAVIEKNIRTAIFLMMIPTLINAQNDHGQTPLHIAANLGSVELVKQLIGKKANINTADKSGHTPLHLAAFFNNLETAALLVKYGADLTAQDKQGYTPYDHALEQEGSPELQRLLRLPEERLTIDEQLP